MKKPYNFTETSTKRCSGCNKPLKRNLISSNPSATKCYCCWNISKKKLRRDSVVTSITRKGRTINRSARVKIIDYLKIQTKNRNNYNFNKNI